MECCIYLHEKVSFLIINQVQTGFEKNEQRSEQRSHRKHAYHFADCDRSPDACRDWWVVIVSILLTIY